MKTRACAVALLLAFAPAAFPAAPAYAQAGDAMTEMARARFQEGVKFFDAKRFEEARAAFLQAYALKHHPAVLLNLAQSELRSNHHVEAARHFATYLRENPAASPLEKGDAEKGLAEARTKTGRVQIAVNANGAEVLIDDELIGTSPLPEPVDVGPGNHKIEARFAGHSATVTVAAAAAKVVNATLSVEGGSVVPIVAPLPGGGGSASPAASPGSPTGDTTGALSSSPPGADQPSPSADPSASTSGREPIIPWFKHNKLAWVGAGVTVVGVGMGIGFSMAASSAGSEADDRTSQIHDHWASDPEAQIAYPKGNGLCGPPAARTSKFDYSQACNQLRDKLDAQSSDKTAATVGWVLAGVGVAGTAALYYFTSKHKEAPPAVAILPMYAPGHTGLALTGAF